jgi:hypothetical protein
LSRFRGEKSVYVTLNLEACMNLCHVLEDYAMQFNISFTVMFATVYITKIVSRGVIVYLYFLARSKWILTHRQWCSRLIKQRKGLHQWLHRWCTLSLLSRQKSPHSQIILPCILWNIRSFNDLSCTVVVRIMSRHFNEVEKSSVWASCKGGVISDRYEVKFDFPTTFNVDSGHEMSSKSGWNTRTDITERQTQILHRGLVLYILC